MRPFRWERPQSVAAATELLHDLGADAQPIAGGQSLLLAMKARLAQPACLISLSGVDCLSGVAAEGTSVTIGATTTYAELARERSSANGVLSHVAGVTSRIADTAVRSMATVGGAACQAEPAFDAPVLLTACDARLVLVSAGGTRELGSTEFFLGARQTARRPDELLQSLRLPASPDMRYGFAKFGARAHDAALASVGISIRVGHDGCDEARVVIGGCVEHPTRADGVERWIVGRAPGQALEEIGAVVAEEIEPTISTTPFSAAYRRRLLVGLSRQALATALDRGGDPR